ncbi:adenine phosphoribosyltransferase [Puccinia sorghi]|uniref:adenine phosphoribosyltransferase n=1 Tax=Puccinia sorghi TaxID=27349 RepID=A0A0L6UF05_9BASI|nr:adenine phosphoribosyltransferase [Puccinia sorghi]
MADVELLRSKLTLHPDFPKKGITFVDFLPILRDAEMMETMVKHLSEHVTRGVISKLGERGEKLTTIVGLDARGFLVGPMVAQRLGCGFVPVRKAGKLPGPCVQTSFTKEYGQDSFEVQRDAIKPGDNVVVIDDLIATGGTAKAAGDLVKALDANLLEYLFVIELDSLNGRALLDAPAYAIIHHQ